MNWFDGLLWPIMVAVAWIMVQFHRVLVWFGTSLHWDGLSTGSGAAWGLSIVGLVLVIRVALIPLFVRQIRASRGLQLLQPEMQVIQKKYKGKSDPASREAMSRETMELYRKHNTNPFSSCLPILLQSPIFFALFRVLNSLTRLSTGDYPKPKIGPMTRELAGQAESATIFGAPLSGTFLRADGNLKIQVVTVILIVAMSATTFFTQRQLTRKNMPKAALEGPMAQQQKMLLYMMPLIFAFSGVNFPIGVLIYWTVSNMWTMGQQFYTIRRMPAPGSQAEVALKERQARRAAQGHGIATATVVDGRPVIEEGPRSGQRQQPVRKDRAKARAVAPPMSGTPEVLGAAGNAGDAAAATGGTAAGTDRTSAAPTGKRKRPAPDAGSPSATAAPRKAKGDGTSAPGKGGRAQGGEVSPDGPGQASAGSTDETRPHSARKKKQADAGDGSSNELE